MIINPVILGGPPEANQLAYDIQNVWYVKALKELSENLEEKEKESDGGEE